MTYKILRRRCAFSNTPKLQTVKGQGWIVRKDWIEDCHKLRKRLLASEYELILMSDEADKTICITMAMFYFAAIN